MAVNHNNDRQSLITSRDLRACVFYAGWLNAFKRINTTNVPRQDAQSCRQALNQLINQFIPDKNEQTRLMSEMETGREENILPPEDFDWLRQSERATFWLWAYIYKVSDYTLGINPPENAEYGTNWYHRMNLSSSPTSHQERINLIMAFFDRILIFTPPVNHLKKTVMERLKDQWKVIYRKPLPLKWLPDEEGIVLWAWDNMQKVQKDKIHDLTGLLSNFSSPGLTTWFTPLSHSERHLALRAALDLWDDSQDTKRLFLLNLNKAWNQQKLRQSRTDKKALNTYLKNETKTRLDFMAERSGVRISDMLEKLINDHYQKTCDGD
ncbi:hypothetical protein I5495_22695 [Citrobacter amalonaticus]|uniref:hypothetical protein n=1 Tax=Citrobacter amalonaticus TaxID=35703 RepID=UPI0019087ABD|nr:hypothetical protein [Citrobacter amalonaticus]MBJ9260145.1 hypothetical protein [Citrobacter amalonaticus]